jgi:molybdate transport system substrate-binding protein
MHRVVLLAVVLALQIGACGSATPGTAPSNTRGDRVSGDVTVFAAASLTDVFEEITRAFEAAHPGVSVTFNFAGSQQLATQIAEGGPADVFASANQTQMDAVRDAGSITGEPVVFARNRLEIAVEPGNPQTIAGLDDLSRPGLKVVLAAENVPAGQYAREALDRAGVTVTPVSLETDVRAVLGKVALGEADAGVVYTSDIASAGDQVEGVEIPDQANIIATYPAAVVADAPNPAGARAFVDHITSDEGRAILRQFGFAAP